MKLYGTHGTCRTSADEILKHNCFYLADGRHGKGAYLWQVSDTENYNGKNWGQAIKLALCYANDRKNDSKYQLSNDDTIVVLGCIIDVEDKNFYDCSSHSHESLFAPYLERFNKQYSEKIEKLKGRPVEIKKLITLLYNGFFEGLKRHTGNSLQIDVYNTPQKLDQKIVVNKIE